MMCLSCGAARARRASGLRRVLEANQIVGGAFEGNLKHGPFEAYVQTRGAMLMRRGLC